MLAKISKHKYFALTLLLVVSLAFFRFQNGDIQQDNYVGYAEALPFSVDKISYYDSRLLPGLPILIYVFGYLTGNFYIAGYLVTFLSFVGSYLLLYKVTESKLSFLPLVFPPALLNLASLIDTEFPFIFLSLLAYYLIKDKHWNLAFFVIGISIWFRLAGIAVLAGIFAYLLINKNLRKFFVNLPYFLIPLVLLFSYNIYLFGGGNPFYQLFTYEALHPQKISFGVLQLMQDLVRALRWGWYKIFISGAFYMVFYAWVYIKAFDFKKMEFWIITSLYFFTLGVNLVPFLENLGRYLAPTVPFFWLIYHSKFKKGWIPAVLLVVSLFVVII